MQRQLDDATALVPRPLGGIGLALLAFALFTLMDTAVKLLGGRYHVLQIIVLSSAFALPTVLAIAACRGDLGRLRTARPGLHGLRWAVSCAGTAAAFHAYATLPLADVYAILFASPLLITVLAVPLLGERVGPGRWAAVLAGFAGVLVMLRPGQAPLEPVALLALLAALAQAVNMVLVGRLGRTEAPESLGLYGNLLTCALGAPLLPLVWQAPTGPDLLLFALSGAISGSGFWLLASAFRLAPAALVAPFQYSQMPYALLVGWLLFGTSPEPAMLLGAAIVIGSGLCAVAQEALAPARARAAAAPA